jgi:hypothetical protein
MAEGHQRDAWDRTSAIMATVLNSQRGKGQRAIQPRELNPFLHAAAKDRTSDVKYLAALCGVTKQA